MKKLLIFLLFISFNSQAQTIANRKVDVGNFARIRDLPSILATEGNTYATGISSTIVGSGTVVAISVAGSTTTVSYTTALFIPQLAQSLGKAMVLNSTSAWFDQDVSGVLSQGANVLANIPTPFFSRWNINQKAGITEKYSASGVIHSNMILLSCSIQKVGITWPTGVALPTINTVTSLTLGYNLETYGTLITDDLNTTADLILDVWGDSINDAQGATVTGSMPGYKLRSYYDSLGYNIRWRNWSARGSSSIQHIQRIQDGTYATTPANLYYIALGTNDANSGITASVYAAQIMRLVSYAFIRNPKAKVLVCGIPPINISSTRETTSIAFSSAVSTAITAYNSSNGTSNQLFYIANVRNAFSATDASYFSADGVHPNDLGYTFYGYALKNFLNATPAARNLSTTY